MGQERDKFCAGRYLAYNCVAGALTGILWGILMLATNTAGLYALIAASANPEVNAIIFLAGSMLAFSPITIAVSMAAIATENGS